MLKDPSAPYGSGVYKCKRYGTVSVVVMGYTPGKGKYDDTIGAVVFGVHDDYTGDLIEVGQCSGMDDVLRRAFHESDIGKVIDVRAQEFTGRKLRHPRFDCWRPDVNPEDCTLKKLQMDFAYCRPPCHTSPHSIAPRLSSS